MVGINKSSKYVFDRTSYRFDMSFGLVDNKTGGLISDIQFGTFDLMILEKVILLQDVFLTMEDMAWC
ncbi:MAG: hypothetical protein R2769_10840 [Saprospiraceae bacterium]